MSPGAVAYSPISAVRRSAVIDIENGLLGRKFAPAKARAGMSASGVTSWESGRVSSVTAVLSRGFEGKSARVFFGNLLPQTFRNRYRAGGGRHYAARHAG